MTQINQLLSFNIILYFNVQTTVASQLQLTLQCWYWKDTHILTHFKFEVFHPEVL